MSAIAFAVFTSFVKESTVAIIALFVPEKGRAVFCGAKLRPETISKIETKGRREQKLTYLRTRSPLGDPSTAAIQVAASALVAYVT